MGEKTEGYERMNSKTAEIIGWIMAGSIFLAIVIGIIVSFATSPKTINSDNSIGDESSTLNTVRNNYSTNNEPSVSGVNVDSSAIGDLCTDTAALKTNSNINVISISNFNEQFREYYGYTDKDGNPYYLYSWNGSYSNGDAVAFNCYVIAPSGGSARIIELSVGSTRLQGDLFLNGVYKNGEKVE